MSIEITPELLAELRRKSEAIEAKCRVWEYDKYSMEVVTEGGIHNVASTYNCEREGQFIAIANPSVVLALVAEIERLRGQHDLPDGYEIEALGLTQGMGW